MHRKQKQMKNTNNTQPTIIDETNNEIQWKKIPGHSRYLVSNSAFPVVWDTKKNKVCHVSKMRADGGNVYDYVNLRRDDDGSYHGVPLHRVVALAWIPNPHGYRVVDHIDDNPRNNDPRSNLRWVSDSANHSKPAAKNKMSRSMLAAWRDPIKRANMVAAQVRRRTREKTEKLLDGIASMIVDFRRREGLANV